MATIPRYTQNRAQQAPLRASTAAPSTPQGTFGPDLSGVSREVTDMALRAADRANTAQVMEADSQLTEFENSALYDPENGALNARGKNAFGLPDEVMSQFDTRVNEIRNTLRGPQVQAFEKLVAQRRQQIDRTLQRHVTSEIATYEQGQADALITGSQQTATNNYNDDERIGVELRRQRGVIMARGKDMGRSEEEIALAIKEAESTTLSKVLARQAQNDPYAARERFKSMESHLTPSNRDAVLNRIESEIRQREAEARARRVEQRQLRAIARAEVSDRAQDAMAAYAAGLPFDNPPSREDFQAAYGDEAEERFESFNRYQQLQPALQELATASPEEAQQIMAEFSPAPGGVAGEDFKERQAIAQTLQRSYESLINQREDDPAGYVLRYSPPVRQLAEDAQQNPSPETYQALTRANLAEQRRLGVQNPVPLTQSQSEGFVRRFYEQDEGGENAAQLIEGSSQLYQGYWPAVLEQLGPKMPPTAKFIASGVPKPIAEMAASASQIKDEELYRMLEPGAKADIQSRVLSELEGLRQTMAPQGGGMKEFSEYREAITKTAAYAVARGESPQAAVEKVVRGLTDNYHPIESTYRVPKTVDYDAVRIGTDIFLKNLSVDAVDPLQGLPGVPDEVNAQQTLESIKEGAEWVTTENEDGLYLMSDGYVVLGASGEPITLAWDELVDIGSDQDALQQRRESNWLNSGF